MTPLTLSITCLERSIKILSLVYTNYHSYSEIKSDYQKLYLMIRRISKYIYIYLIYTPNTRVMKPVTANTIAHHSTLINDYLLDRFSINTFLYFICRHEVHIFTIHLLISHGNIKNKWTCKICISTYITLVTHTAP